MYGVTAALAFVEDLNKAGKMPKWWVSQLGHKDQKTAATWAMQNTDAGATWLGVAADHTYTPNRDRNIRNHFGDYESGVLAPATPNLTWEYISWLKSASPLPVIVKGVLNGEDAAAAVRYGADAIIVSNHGGRAYDGAVPSLMALPECVAAVKGKIPVMLDGGIRRGSDVLKALALGATAVLVGRPPAWGVAAFGSVGVQRVMELLAAELTVAMGIAGAPNLKSIRRDMVYLPWEGYRRVSIGVSAMRGAALVILMGGIGCIAAGATHAADAGVTGVYTAEQAKRGMRDYIRTCSSCHGEQFNGAESGPPLTGDEFLEHWRGKPGRGAL